MTIGAWFSPRISEACGRKAPWTKRGDSSSGTLARKVPPCLECRIEQCGSVWSGVARSTGKPFTSEWAMRFIVKNGNVTFAQVYEDTGAIAAALRS